MSEQKLREAAANLLRSAELAEIFIGTMAEMSAHLEDHSSAKTSKKILDGLEVAIKEVETALDFNLDENSEATDND